MSEKTREKIIGYKAKLDRLEGLIQKGAD